MSWVTLLLVAAGAVLILFLLLMIVAQVRNARNIEALKREVEEPKGKPEAADLTAETPAAEAEAQPAAVETETSAATELPVETAVEEVTSPDTDVTVSETIEAETPAESAAAEVEMPEEVVSEAPGAKMPAEPEIEEAGVEIEIPEEILAEEAAPEEAFFTPKEYPEFSNARAVEQLGLSQDEADLFIAELVTQIEAELPNIDAAFEAEDSEQIERVSHMLKGSATSLGEGGVADVLVDLNTYCKEGSDPEVLKEHINNLNHYFQQLKEQFPA